jgi:hypothetical protein
MKHKSPQTGFLVKDVVFHARPALAPYALGYRPGGLEPNYAGLSPLLFFQGAGDLDHFYGRRPLTIGQYVRFEAARGHFLAGMARVDSAGTSPVSGITFAAKFRPARVQMGIVRLMECVGIVSDSDVGVVMYMEVDTSESGSLLRFGAHLQQGGVIYGRYLIEEFALGASYGALVAEGRWLTVAFSARGGANADSAFRLTLAGLAQVRRGECANTHTSSLSGISPVSCSSFFFLSFSFLFPP